MAKITYNKLVRDHVPDIIVSEGRTPTTSAIAEADRLHHLYLKLLEEAHEVFRSGDESEFVKEASDLIEVLHALASEYGVNWERIEAERVARERELGGFSQGVFLESVRDRDGGSSSGRSLPMTPCLLTRCSSPSLLDVLRRELLNSQHCRIATAFCTRGMLNQMVRPFEGFLGQGGQLQILTSVMNNFNNPDDLVHLRRELPQCEMRVFYPGQGDGAERFASPPTPFHLKSFLFEKLDGQHSLIVGSSNLTMGGLEGNEEWNLYSNSEVNLPFSISDARSIYETARAEFDRHWSHESVEITKTFLKMYRPRWQEMRRARRTVQKQLAKRQDETILPRPAQNEALQALTIRRRLGSRKAAVIAATGLGKTHLAAFDFKQSGLRNVLFIMHRENVLREAREIFRRVLDEPQFGVILSGQSKAAERKAALKSGNSVFAMIQTVSRPDVLSCFSPGQFQYVVVDEFHHSEATSYQIVLAHFAPDFFLGLTATPERMDGRDVLRFCDYNVAYEARLFDAIDQGWLAPFQYFAIHDETDYSQIRWTGIGYDETELERGLSTDTRSELITRNLKRFLPATGKIKALAFCANKGHARYMKNEFVRHGLAAECLLGESPEDVRTDAIHRLQDEADPLEVICSVDVLAEGVDIPAVSHILMLRPTLSFTVFLQQLGRGLRKDIQKDYLVVLDFVGNHRNSYVAPLVLRGYSSVEQFRREKREDRDFQLPACCTVDVDTPVQRIWDTELRRVVTPRPRKELLKVTYGQMRDDLGHTPCLLDFLANPDACDPHAFVKAFGNWLRTKEEMEDLTDYERGLLGTLGEGLLQHVERELSPVRSYKMVVLKVLLDDGSENTQWKVDWVAHRFCDHYLSHLEQLGDCSVLANVDDPEAVPLAKVAALLRSMPLKYLSNTKADFFRFDRKNGIFAVKEDARACWQDLQFRGLLKERVSYALARYFMRKGIDLSEYGFNLDDFRHREATHDTVRPGAAVTVLPFYPTLRIAAGVFREGAAEYECNIREIPDPGHRFRSDRHFVVQVEGDSMDGGGTPILNGDVVVLERIDSSRAGSLTGERAIAVEFRDISGDTAYALKEIQKDTHGRYWLHSWNPTHDDAPVDSESMFPFARFICRLGDSS